MTTVAAPRLSPFSVDHFVAYAQRLVLDTGDTWEVEDFQIEIVRPILEGYTETWAILPQGSGKTTLMAGFALYHADYTPSPWVPIAASSRDQAEILARQAYQMIRATPGMVDRFKIYEGYREIRSLRNGGRGVKVYAADTSTGDGVIPTLAICDEGHRWPDLSLYRLWKGKLNKRQGQIVMISTAGEPGGEFENTRDMIREQAAKVVREGAHVCAEGPDLVMNEWRVQDPAQVSNMEAVKEANPFSQVTIRSLRAEFNSPTTDLGEWKRLVCNIPARTVYAAITETEWDAAELHLDPSEYEISEFGLPTGQHVDVGADVAWKHDTFSIAPLWQSGTGFNLLGKPIILEPPRDGSSMHPDEPKRAFEQINDLHPIDAVIIDLERAEDVAAWLEDEMGVEVIDRPQGNAYHVEDYDAFMKGLRNGTLKHTGDDGLRRHVMNAIARNLPGDKKRFDRPSQSRAKKRQLIRVIDALTAAAMVNQYAGQPQESNEPMVFWR